MVVGAVRGDLDSSLDLFLDNGICIYTVCLDIFIVRFLIVHHQLPVKVHIKHVLLVLSNQIDVEEAVRF